MQHQLFGQKQHKNQVKLDEIKELLDLPFLTFWLLRLISGEEDDYEAKTQHNLEISLIFSSFLRFSVEGFTDLKFYFAIISVAIAEKAIIGSIQILLDFALFNLISNISGTYKQFDFVSWCAS